MEVIIHLVEEFLRIGFLGPYAQHVLHFLSELVHERSASLGVVGVEEVLDSLNLPHGEVGGFGVGGGIVLVGENKGSQDKRFLVF